MPTFQELIQDTNSVLDYNPDLEAYRSQVGRAINRHYLEISGRYPWLFLQKQFDLTLYASVEGATGITIVKDATNSRKVTGSGTSFHSDMEGHFLYVGDEKRRIVHVESTTELYIRTAFPSGTIDSATTGWEIKFEYYALPVDVGDVMGITDRENDRGKIYFMDYRKEEEHFLDKDQIGDPIIAVEKPADFRKAPSDRLLTSLQAGGSLVDGATYEYMYTITTFGQEGAPSVVSEITATSASKTVRLLAMDDLDFSSGNWSGRTRKIYRRRQDRGERFFLIATQAAASLGTTYDDDGSASITYDTAFFEEGGMYQNLRMWQTPGTDQTVEVRYQSIPPRLQGEQDQPRWPKQYHHLLVYMAIQDAATQHGMTGFATLYERRATELLQQMKARWLSRTNRDYVRQGFDRHLRQKLYERWAHPVKL